MKTFLWTTLFWIVAAIAGLLCLGFGNLGTQVLENEWIVSFLPKNIQTKACEPIVTSALQDVDWCAMAEEKDCTPAEENEDESESTVEETTQFQESLNSIITNQEAMYKYLQESVADLRKSINNLQNNNRSQNTEDSVVDEKQLQRLQLQAQIEALQNEMANL